jgi:hypothetical protein
MAYRVVFAPEASVHRGPVPLHRRARVADDRAALYRSHRRDLRGPVTVPPARPSLRHGPAHASRGTGRCEVRPFWCSRMTSTSTGQSEFCAQRSSFTTFGRVDPHPATCTGVGVTWPLAPKAQRREARVDAVWSCGVPIGARQEAPAGDRETKSTRGASGATPWADLERSLSPGSWLPASAARSAPSTRSPCICP